MSTVRSVTAVVLLIGCGVLAHGPFIGTPGRWLGASQLPLQIGDWRGADAAPSSDDDLQVLRADGLVNRVYWQEPGAPVGLYVAYYAQQHPGISIHSPLHCLPGSGWEVQSSDTIDLRVITGRAGYARRLIAQKNLSRALVLYWYSIHGRRVASETASRFYLVNDRLRLGRNDAGLVRIVVPLRTNAASAEQQALAFVRVILPHLSQLWS